MLLHVLLAPYFETERYNSNMVFAHSNIEVEFTRVDFGKMNKEFSQERLSFALGTR